MPAGKAQFILDVDFDKGEVNLNKAVKGFDRLEKGAVNAGIKGSRGLDSLGLKITGLNQLLEISNKLFNLFSLPINAIISAGSEFENLNLQLESVLGSAEKAENYFQWIKEFSATTPFQIEELTQATIVLESFGINAQQYFRTFGDAAAGLRIPLKDLSRIMGQIFAKPNAQMEEMLQLVERGVPVFEILKTEMGLTADQVADIGRLGIAGTDVFAALSQGMSRLYGGTMDKFSKTWSGLLSTFKDNIKLFLGEISGPLLETVKDKLASIIAQARSWAEDGTLERVAKNIGGFLSSAIGSITNIVEIVMDWKDEIVFAGKAWLIYFAVSHVTAWSSAMSGAVSLVKSGVTGLTTNLARMIDSFRLARKFGVGAFGSIKTVLDNAGASITGMKGETGLLQTALKNIGLVGLAAFAGWKLGTWIGKITKLNNLVSNFFDYMQGGQEYYDKMSAAMSLNKEQYDSVQRREAVLELAANYNILNQNYKETGYNLKTVYLELSKNQEAYERLDAVTKTHIDRMVSQNDVYLEKKRKLEEIRKAIKGYEYELYNATKLQLSFLNVHIPAWQKAQKLTYDTGEAAKKAAKEYESLAKSLGFVTRIGIGEITKESKILIKLYDQYKDQLESSKDLQDSVWKKSAELLNKYALAGQPIPANLRDIHDHLRLIITDRDNLRKEGLFESLIGGMTGSPLNGLGVMMDLTVQATELAREYGETWLQNNDPFYELRKNLYEALRIQMTMLGIPIPDILNPGKIEVSKLQKVIDSLSNVSTAGHQVVDMFSSLGIMGDQTAERLHSIFDGVGNISVGLENMKEPGKGFLGFLGNVVSGAQIAVAGINILSNVIGGLFDLLTGDGVQEAIDRENSWMNLTEEMNDRLHELAESVGNTHAATSMMFSEIMKESEITIENFSQFASRAEEILLEIDRGFMTEAQAANELGESWNYLISQARTLGLEGSREMNQIIWNLQERGLKVAEISGYINNQLRSGLGALKEQTGEAAKIADSILATQENMLGFRVGSSDWKEAQAELLKLQAEFDNLASPERFQRLQILAQGYMQALSSEGMSMLEIAQDEGYAAILANLEKIKAAGGYESNLLSEMLGYRQFVVDNEQVLNNLQLTQTQLEAFGNSGSLRAMPEVWQTLQTEAQGYFDRLLEGTGDEMMAYQAIAPLLAKLKWYSEQNNITLDENSQKLIENAENAGINLDVMKTQQELQYEMNDSLNKLVFIMEKFTGVTADANDELTDMAKNSADAFGTAYREVDRLTDTVDRLSNRGIAIDINQIGNDAQTINVPGFAEGGIFETNRPRLMVVGEGKERERVVVTPASKMPGYMPLPSSSQFSPGGVSLYIERIELHNDIDIDQRGNGTQYDEEKLAKAVGYVFQEDVDEVFTNLKRKLREDG